MNAYDIKNDIKKRAHEIGFDIVGFTTADDFDSDILYQRKEMGYLSGLEEKDIEKRVKPKQLLKSAKSIIALGLCYNTGYSNKKGSDVGYISRCAYGLDYHKVMKNMMEELVKYIKRMYNVLSVYMVDTGPLVDRMVATRAGIGWYGKNCSIINIDYGSWIFLGEILTELKIPPDDKMDRSCEDCEICLRACPTGALVAPYTLNASRCLSYNTIKKGILPDEIKEKLGRRIYGCDTCQDVCPFNKIAKPVNRPEFKPSFEVQVSLKDLVSMNKERFNELFGQTSASWRGKTVIQRNAIIAMGNSGDKKYVELLKEYLDDPRLGISDAAKWALKKLGISGTGDDVNG